MPPVAGKDVVELGCGTAYWSAWLARRGGRVVALDNSPRQLATARALQQTHGLAFPLIHADAERPPLRDASTRVRQRHDTRVTAAWRSDSASDPCVGQHATPIEMPVRVAKS